MNLLNATTLTMPGYKDHFSPTQVPPLSKKLTGNLETKKGIGRVLEYRSVFPCLPYKVIKSSFK